MPRNTLFLVGYAAAAVLGRAVPQGGPFALFWPAAGVAMVWALTLTSRGHRLRAAAAVGTVWAATGMVHGHPPAALLLGAVAHALLMLASAATFRACRGRRAPVSAKWLASTRAVFHLVLAALVGAAVSAPVAATALALASTGWQLDLAGAWVARNAAGTLAVASVLLLLLDRRGADPELERTARRQLAVRLEFGAHLLASLLLGWLVFGPSSELPLSFGALAGATWAGYRFSPLTAAASALVYGAGASYATLRGWGPFSGLDDQLHQALVVQLFAAAGTLLAVLLSVSVRERRVIGRRLARSEAAARQQAELFRAVTVSVTDAILVVDSAGTVVAGNPAADRLLGRGAPVRHFEQVAAGFQNLDRTPVGRGDSAYHRAVAGETVDHHPYLHVDPLTGRESVQAVSAAPLAGASGSCSGEVVVVLHDVTAQHAQVAELESFAGMVAHDLKSPLTGISAWSELLLEDDAEALRGQGLERILASARRMDRMIDDLLEYSRTSARKLATEALDLDELVGTLAHELDGETGAVTVEHQALGTVQADSTLVRQTLTNLLGNAVKYVAPGVRPHIVVTSRPHGDMLAVTVQDNGIGIPADARHRIFESFFRAAHAYPGTGLGLAICKRAVERHGGEILVEDDTASGTAITFTLPAARTPVAA